MDNDIFNKYLYDIELCINSIDEFLVNDNSFENYSKNKMLRNAVERNLEIIGEAMNQILKLNPSINISNARRIVDARNKIIHSYDEIEDVNIWIIVKNHLPILKQEINHLLNQK